MLARLITLILTTLLLSSCDITTGTVRMLIADYRQFDADAVHSIFDEQSALSFIGVSSPPGMSAIDALSNDEADLALVENSTAFVSGIRTVLPVFESVLHILIRDDFEPGGFNQPLQNVEFYVANQSPAGIRFIEIVTRRQGLGQGKYSISHSFDPQRTDIIVYFGPIDPANTSWAKPGFTLISLANNLNPQRKFYEEGIGYTAPNMNPKMIPALTYELPGNEEEIATVSVDTLLVARKDVSEAKIYELTKTFIEQKPRFTAIAPQLFSGINESFDPLDLSFPLHKGARSYIRRDDPGFIERYAETINMLVYVSFLLISAFLAFARWRERRKKDRVDVFYERVMAIRDRIGQSPSAELLEELEQLEREAFSSLIREKLAANDSFRIFTDMLVRLRADLKEQD
jgi:NMT1 family protein